MSLRERFAELRPGQFFLDAGDLRGMSAWLKDKGWISADQEVISAERAGEGNMNCTLRVATGEGSFILKQARPWVEKYPSIDAPLERVIYEEGFYRVTASDDIVASRMPRMLGYDVDARMLMLEDLGHASDFTSIYSGAAITDEELHILLTWLRTLHERFRSGLFFSNGFNRAMRELNHLHIFDFPLRPHNGLNLDEKTPGLQAAAKELQDHDLYRKRVFELGQIYLDKGLCLLHGDFFPGSWLRARNSTWVIDPEFCFWGAPEFDLGVMLGHLLLAGMPLKRLDEIHAAYPVPNPELARAFAGVEIMRRLIGVAQLPLRYGLAEKRLLLDLSRELVIAL